MTVNPSDKQPAGEYPEDVPAVLPADVDPFACTHEGDPPVCMCAHDWRIEWGNVARVSKRRAVYVTDSP